MNNSFFHRFVLSEELLCGLSQFSYGNVSNSEDNHI